eukprot:superscaffoldBa00002439_g14244
MVYPSAGALFSPVALIFKPPDPDPNTSVSGTQCHVTGPGSGLRQGERMIVMQQIDQLAQCLMGSLLLILRREGYTMQVNVNDYLDIYCPHYNDSQRMVGTGEQYVLYMVSYRGYRNCDPQLGFKRWECNRPHAPHAPIKFSEKFQRYSAFSLGYEFHVGQEYYYICEWSSNQF